MNFRLTAILFGTVFAVGVVLLYMSFTDDTGNPADGTLLLTELAGEKADNITEVELEKDGGKLAFKRAGKDGWAVTAPVAARADANAVNALVTAVLGLRPTTFGEMPTNAEVAGLNAGLAVTLRAENGKSETVKIGNLVLGKNRSFAFVGTAARPRPLAVTKSSVEALLKDSTADNAGKAAKWVADYRSKTVFSTNPVSGADTVDAVKLTRNGKDLGLARGKNGWEFTSPAGWGDASAAADTAAAPGTLTGVRPIVAGLVGLAAGSPDDFLDAPADLTPFGLNPGNPDRVRVELKGGDGKTEVAFLGKKVEDKKDEKKDAFSPPANKIYVQIEGTPGVIRATASGLDGLAAVIDNPTPLRDRDLVKDTVKTSADAIDLVAGGQTVQLRKVGAEWKLVGGPNDPQAANQKAANDLLALVTQPRIVKDFPAANDAHFAGGDLRAELKIYTDAVDFGDGKSGPKLKAGATPTVIQIGRKDGSGVYVRRIRPDGSKTDFLLPDRVKLGTDLAETDVLAAVAKSRPDFLDPSLPSFSSLQANKLQVTQGAAVVLEITKDKAATPPAADAGWKYVKPDGMKDQTADTGAAGDLFNLLATQSATKFVRELTDADKGKEKDVYLGYGLAAEAPRLKVVVGLDAPAPGNERVYFFGNETDDKQAVYARVEGRGAVFTVPKFLFDRFAAADLRDRTLARFDPAKLKVVRIRGWRQTTGGELLVREFRREGASWVAVSPPTPAGITVDGTKVDEFVRAVQGLRVKEFRTGGESPDHRFNPEQDGFEVTLDFDGADDLVLNFGTAVDGGAARIVRLMTVGGAPRPPQIVTVIPEALGTFRENPKAFAR